MPAARSFRLGYLKTVMASARSAYHGAAHASNAPQFTVTSLGRWSCVNKQLPPVDKIKALHVYDFDNTLFQTPLPNMNIWFGATFSKLCSPGLFINGGWWHDSSILAATGQGLEKEEPRAWEGWWNEQIVELVRLSSLQPDALCVLLTGRSEGGFADLINKMITSKKLEFDMVCLKPRVSPTNQAFGSTMHFKQLFLDSLMETYKGATELKIYEDRPKHSKGFRDFFAEFNRRQRVIPTRGPIAADVIQVPHISTSLNPVVEVAAVQKMVNVHNETVDKLAETHWSRMEIKKLVRSTGYMINKADVKRLVALAQVPPLPRHRELKRDDRFVLIANGDCPPTTLAKIGGLGSKMLWEVTATACLDDSLWAVRVRPVPSTAVYHTGNDVPAVVLGLRRNYRMSDVSKITNWVPAAPDQAFVFETSVGENAVLKIQTEREDDEDLGAKKVSKRKHEDDDEDDEPSRSGPGPYSSRSDVRGYHTSARGPRGRGDRGMRGGRGGRGGRRGGGFHGYRSLDDVEPKNEQGGYGPKVDYDDTSRALSDFSTLPTGPRALQGRGGAPAFARPRGGGSYAGGADLQKYY